MWLDEFRYKWGLRKYLKTYAITRVSHDLVEDFTRKEGEPDIRRAMEKEQIILSKSTRLRPSKQNS